MKTLILSTLLVLITTAASLSQSKSFETFREKFRGEEDVHCLRANGFWVRTILALSGEDDANDALKRIKNVRLITVPKEAFNAQRVTVSGFKKVLKDDSFEELVRATDVTDDVTVYIKSTPNRDNRYIILEEESGEVVLIEVSGYIDPEYLLHNLPFSKS